MNVLGFLNVIKWLCFIVFFVSPNLSNWKIFLLPTIAIEIISTLHFFILTKEQWREFINGDYK